MDESLSRAMNFIKEEKSSGNSSVLEDLPWQKEAENSDPSDRLLAIHVNMEKDDDIYEVPVLSPACSFQERDLCYTVPFSKPFLRRNNTRKEIALNRACKKLELFLGNRDLPVDRESLHSAANKDAFDLRDLSESLPSSTSEKIRAMKMIWQERPGSYSSQMQQIEKFEALTNRSLCPFSSKMERLYVSDTTPASEATTSVKSQRLRCTINEGSLKHSLMKAQKWCRWKRIYSQILSSELEKLPASNKQTETSDEGKNLDEGKAVQNWVGLDLEFTETSDDKQDKEKQNSGNQQSIEIAPLPILHQDMGQCSSWDSEKNWMTDSQFPDVRVPLNSPNKGNADNASIFMSMQKMLEKTRQCSKELRALNYLRNELSESMDESESGMPSSIQAFRASFHNHLNFRKETDKSCSRQLVKGKRIKDKKEAVKSFRSHQGHFLLGSAKSDKVVPD